MGRMCRCSPGFGCSAIAGPAPLPIGSPVAIGVAILCARFHRTPGKKDSHLLLPRGGGAVLILGSCSPWFPFRFDR
jgi:hypothetical protein